MKDDIPPWGGPLLNAKNVRPDFETYGSDESGMTFFIALMVGLLFVGSLVVFCLDRSQERKRSDRTAAIVSLARQAAASGLPVEACPYDAVSDREIWVRVYAER